MGQFLREHREHETATHAMERGTQANRTCRRVRSVRSRHSHSSRRWRPRSGSRRSGDVVAARRWWLVACPLLRGSRARGSIERFWRRNIRWYGGGVTLTRCAWPTRQCTCEPRSSPVAYRPVARRATTRRWRCGRGAADRGSGATGRRARPGAQVSIAGAQRETVVSEPELHAWSCSPSLTQSIGPLRHFSCGSAQQLHSPPSGCPPHHSARSVESSCDMNLTVQWVTLWSGPHTALLAHRVRVHSRSSRP